MTALARAFTYADCEVRTMLVDGDPWFVAADVCAVLGIVNSRDALGRLDDDEKGVGTTDTLGGAQRVAVVNEPGLYGLTWTSRKPEAAAFRRWVKHDVLPEIRRTGAYIGTGQPAIPGSFADALQLAADQQRQIEAQAAELSAAAPKVEAFDQLMSADGTYSMEAVAKILGWGRNRLFAYLRTERVLQPNNIPYQRYAHWFAVRVSSYTRSDGTSVPTHTTRVRSEGMEAIRKRVPHALSPAAL